MDALEESEGPVFVTPILLVVAPLAVVLFALIFRMNHVAHYAPQAYYRRKTNGAPVAYGTESLGPRLRKDPPADSSGVTPATPGHHDE